MKRERTQGFVDYARQIVEPLAALRGRKRRMAEELAGHLMESIAREIARGVDERAAITAAQQRLGNAVELREQLQACVPVLERIVCGWLVRKENRMSRWIWLAAIFAVLFGMAMVLPALAKIKEQHAPFREAAIPLAIGAAIVLSGLGTVGYGIKRWCTRAS